MYQFRQIFDEESQQAIDTVTMGKIESGHVSVSDRYFIMPNQI
ncbi:unnamed protein product, partial [Rotaria sp. Silwood1]